MTVPGGIPQGHPKGKSRRKPVFSEALDPNTPWTPKVPVHMSTPEYPEYPAQARLSSQGRAQLSRSIARSCALYRADASACACARARAVGGAWDGEEDRLRCDCTTGRAL